MRKTQLFNPIVVRIKVYFKAKHSFWPVKAFLIVNNGFTVYSVYINKYDNIVHALCLFSEKRASIILNYDCFFHCCMNLSVLYVHACESV